MRVKIKYCLVVVFITMASNVFSQDPYLNQQKYWYMRQRLTEKFMKVGPGHGESLPAAQYEIIAEEGWNI